MRQTTFQTISLYGKAQPKQALVYLLRKAQEGIRQNAIAQQAHYKLFTRLAVNGHFHLTSEVKKSDGTVYQVEIAVWHSEILINEPSTEILYSCECEYFRKTGKPCKHITLVVLDLLNLKPNQVSQKEVVL